MYCSGDGNLYEAVVPPPSYESQRQNNFANEGAIALKSEWYRSMASVTPAHNDELNTFVW